MCDWLVYVNVCEMLINMATVLDIIARLMVCVLAHSGEEDELSMVAGLSVATASMRHSGHVLTCLQSQMSMQSVDENAKYEMTRLPRNTGKNILVLLL